MAAEPSRPAPPPPASSPSAPPRRASSRRLRLAAAAVGLAAGAVAAAWVHLESDFQWSVESLRSELAELGPFGPLIFVALVALRPFLLLPSWVFLVVGGILFGTLWGTIWSSIGTLAGGAWIYAVARGLGRDEVERRLRGAVERVDRYLGRAGALWVAAWSLMPAAPLTPVYAAAGLSSLRPLPFVLGATAGIVPRCALYTFFAASLVSGDTTRVAVASGLLAATLALGWFGRRLWLRGRRRGAVE